MGRWGEADSGNVGRKRDEELGEEERKKMGRRRGELG